MWAMIGSGSVVTKDIPDYGLAWGNPARLHGFACPCGERLGEQEQRVNSVLAQCPQCGQIIEIPRHNWEQIQ
jgi:acyl-[acyl carrier protein]--UDP-N-acetylglucosamine O-acyltransferase